MADNFDWVDKEEKKQEEARSKEYFNIKEGNQTFVLLSHCAPLPQVWDNAAKKYRIAEEGDKNISVKGLCWVLQDGVIKSAKLPYGVVKAIRGYQQNPEWEFAIPFPHTFTLSAKNAGSKEVEYTLNASPKKVEIPKEIIDELAKKPTPEELVEKIKGKVSQGNSEPAPDYPQEEINPDDIPF